MMESMEMLGEATRIFSNADDAKALKAATKEEQQIRTKWVEKEQDAKSIVKALASDLEMERRKTQAVSSSADYTMSLESMENSKFEVAKECNNVEQSLVDKAREIEKLEKEIMEAKQAVQNSHTITEVDLPKVRHAFSLYGMISNIQWHHGDSNRIAGTAVNDSTKELQKFSLDSTRLSKEWVKEHLWELVSGPV